MTSSLDRYYNALLAAGRVRHLSIAEAGRDLIEVNRSIVPPLFYL